ncbi:MAG TPA: phosphoglycerate dehydrogenase [Gammaproteobacteria bacterium]|nr:phosphoglycerate dehydrogenase [Gammaproteobacteria bacterium]
MLNPIARLGLNQFPPESYTIAAELSEPDAMILRSTKLTEKMLAKSLKVIGRAGAGVNNIPVAALTRLGIPVLNTPGANANAVRELVIAGMLLASRHLAEALRYVDQLKLSEEAELDKQVEQDKKQFAGFELKGKTLGLIGLGAVGVKVANAALDLGMSVIGYDPTITVNRAWELSAEAKQATSLNSLLAEADFISLHIPLTEETKGIINRACFHLMKEGVVLLNFARDGIVDNQALLEALEQKKVFSYVNDFPTVLLKNHPRVISLPHLGASTKEAEENCAVMIVQQVRNFLENGNISNSVNFPSVDMPRNNKEARLAIVNENVPNMVAQISSKLAAADLNIVSLVNQSREGIAYTLIDMNKAAHAALLKEIAGISGVIQVRQLAAS